MPSDVRAHPMTLPGCGFRGLAQSGRLCALVLLGCTAVAAARPVPAPDDVRVAVDRAVNYLLGAQNPDGSWGGALNAVYTFTGSVWSNPETHRSWKVATTGLAVMALLELPEREDCMQAAERGLHYLCANAHVKRPNEWDTMNSWAYIYGLQAVAAAHGNARFVEEMHDELHHAADRFLERMQKYQAVNGGWGYLELDAPRTFHTTWGTSFTTASGIVALTEAGRHDFVVDAKMLARAVKAVRRCRLPSGAYTYSINPISSPRHSEWIDQIKGSLSRIQVCNIALKRAGEPVSLEQFRTGLAHFFAHHRFLDIARHRPIPHETYYLNSGYFYLYGHYYCALVVEELPPDEQSRWWPMLQYEIIKTQQKDGSMWDYDMHSYHKPYGTAFGLAALARSLRAMDNVRGEASPGSHVDEPSAGVGTDAGIMPP